MGKFKKQEARSKNQETIQVKTNDKISKKRNTKNIEVKNKVNLKPNKNLTKKNKTMIKNKKKEQKLIVTNGIINIDGKSKGAESKPPKIFSSVKMNVANSNDKDPSKVIKNKKSSNVNSLKVTKSAIKMKKPKTIEAPTPETKKPTPKLRNFKKAQVPTPTSKKIQKKKGGMVVLVKQKKNGQNLVQSNKKVATKINKNKSATNTRQPNGLLPSTNKKTFRVKNFDEKKFNDIVSLENVKKAIEALNKIIEEASNKMKNSIFADYRYVLNVSCFKIPSCPKRTVKLSVKHKLVSDEDDVAFIVRDLKRGAKRDYEPTIHYWEDQLRKRGISGIKTIVPFNQLKKEYTTFEMKIKFSNMYEYYLCDAAISGHVVGFLGKSCSKKTRSTLFPVRAQNLNNLKNEIQKSLNKTCYHQGQKGNMISIPIATDKMSSTQVAENLLHVVEELKTLYVGGLANIRNMYLRINLKSTSAVPIYISLAEPPSGTPYSIGPREKRLVKLKDRANKILSQFELTKSGELLKLSHDKVLLKRRAAQIESKNNEIGMKKQKLSTLIEKSTEPKIREGSFDKTIKADTNASSTETQNTTEEETDNVQYKDDEIKESDSEINDDVFSDYEEEDESDLTGESDESDETDGESEKNGNENESNEGDETDEKSAEVDSDDEAENEDEDEESD